MGRLRIGLVAALLVIAAAPAGAAEPCQRHVYDGAIACTTTPCYLPGANGADLGDCGKVSVNLTAVTGTLVLVIQGKNPGGDWVTTGTLTESPANYNGTIDIPFRLSRVAVTTCTDCTGHVSVLGYQ